MKAVVVGLITVAALFAYFHSAAVRGQDQSPNARKVTPLIESIQGPALFKAYCAVCHGENGKGDGSMAPALKVKVPDLTRIAARNGGRFPAERVQRHAECPVWTGVHLEQAPPLEKIEFRNLACAVDLGSHSRQVLESATELADVYRATLSVVHVTPAIGTYPEVYLDLDFAAALVASAREELQGLLRSTGAKAEVIVEGGEVDKVVSSIAARLQSDLLIIGRSPTSGILGRLRTHAYAIIRQSPCPVLSV